MAAVWGRAEIDVDIDGRDLPKQVRAATEAAAKEGGKSFRKEFSKQLDGVGSDFKKAFAPIGQSIQKALRPALSKIRGMFNDAFEPARRQARGLAGDINILSNAAGNTLRSAFRRARTEVRSFGVDMENFSAERAPRMNAAIHNVATALRGSINGFRRFGAAVRGAVSGRFPDVMERVRGAFSRTNKEVEKSTKSLGRQGSAWRNLSANTRQWTLIIGAVIASIGQLAVLGSATTGLILALATAFAALGAGIAIAVVGFKGLFEEGAKLNAGAAATKKAFEGLAPVFQQLQTTITNKMFENIADSVKAIGPALKSLEGPLGAFSSIVGESIGSLFDALTSDAALGTFKKLLEGFGPIFTSLTDAVIGFGGALGGILVAALPIAQSFSQSIADVGAAFSTWANGAEGQERLRVFFQTAQVIIPQVVDLIVAAGQALSALVTPETIISTSQLLQALTRFMPVLSEVLTIAANLNVFGLIALALDTVGQALEPLMPILQEFATILSTAVGNSIRMVAPVLNALVRAFAPLLAIIVQLVGSILPPLMASLAPLITAIVGLVGAIGSALLPIFQALVPIIMAVVQAVIPLVEMLGPILTAIITPLVPLLATVGDVFMQIAEILVPIVEAILPPLADILAIVGATIAALMPIVVALITPFLDLIPVLLKIIGPVLPPLISLLAMVADITAQLLLPILKLLTPVFSAIASVISSVLTVAIKIIIGAITILVGWFGDWLKAMKPVVDFLKGVLLGAIDGITKALKFVIDAIKNAIDWFGNLFGAADEAGNRSNSAAGQRGGSGGSFAHGGVLTGPRRILAGEAGPEAIVPLNRSLSQVDPSVRWLSAIAQGGAGAASGGIAGPSRVINVQPGAITIQGPDARRAAIEVVDRIVEVGA